MVSLTVLVVDSSPTFLQSLVQYIEQLLPNRIRVGGALCDGAEALVVSERLRPDVVLWGIGIPALPQLQLLPRLRAMLPAAGIIVLGLLEEGYQPAALAAGADMFLLKDTLTTTLSPAIGDLVRSRSVACSISTRAKIVDLRNEKE